MGHVVADIDVEKAPLYLRVMEGVSDLVGRMRMGIAAGLTFDGLRDLYRIFGFKRDLTVSDYRQRYERGGIAGRVVDALPMATWRGGVELIEDEDAEHTTEFEQAWLDLNNRLHVVTKLQSTDILSRLSTYAVLLIGAPGELKEPLPEATNGQKDVLYLQCYIGSGDIKSSRAGLTLTDGLFASIADARISDYDKDPKSERFGQPIGYQLRRTSFGSQDFSPDVVHWSRVVHIAEGCLDDDISGRPALKRSWNDFDNLEKITGGGSEAFFQRANQGRVWNIDKEIKSLSEPEKADFRTQIEEYEHGITRNVRARGMKVQDLGSDVADFSSPQDAVLTVIAGANAIPKRILTGSEMGELASSQDRDNWRDQVNGRRQEYAGPYILLRLVDRLIEYGYLPTPAQYEPRWGSVMNMTEEEKITKAKGWAETKTEEGPVFTRTEIRDRCYEMGPLDKEQLAELEAMRQARLPPAPVVKPGLRAAEEVDEDLVSILAAAIESGATEVVDAIIGVRVAGSGDFDDERTGIELFVLSEEEEIRTLGSPDQPRDEMGRWTNSAHTTATDISGVKLDAPLKTYKAYHVTKVENAEKILSGGFDLGKVKPRWTNDYAVSLSRGEKPARDYFTQRDPKTGKPTTFNEEKYAVIEVTVKGRLFKSDGYSSAVGYASSPQDFTRRLIDQGYDGQDQGSVIFVNNPKSIVSLRRVKRA